MFSVEASREKTDCSHGSSLLLHSDKVPRQTGYR